MIIYSFIHSGYFYNASSSPLLHRSAPYTTALIYGVVINTLERNMQLRVKCMDTRLWKGQEIDKSTWPIFRNLANVKGIPYHNYIGGFFCIMTTGAYITACVNPLTLCHLHVTTDFRLISCNRPTCLFIHTDTFQGFQIFTLSLTTRKHSVRFNVCLCFLYQPLLDHFTQNQCPFFKNSYPD